jgi:hypothetical protein
MLIGSEPRPLWMGGDAALHADVGIRKDGLLGGGLKVAGCALTLDKW